MNRLLSYVLYVLFCVLVISSPNLCASEVEISGFADFYYAVQEADRHDGDFEFGQAELDFSTEINEKVHVRAAVAYEPNEEVFGLGEFIVDFNLQDKENRKTGIVLGKFYVPFGIDWQVYPSFDRKFVTGPMVVGYTHDSWNDYGIQVYSKTDRYNGVLFLVNGFGYQIAYDASDEFLGYNEYLYSADDPTVRTRDVEMKNGIGGRVGLTPHEIIEVGGSYVIIQNKDHITDIALLGMNLQVNLGDLALKSEFIRHAMIYVKENVLANTGMYAQGVYSYGRFFPGFRYGMIEPGYEGAESINRLSVLCGFVISTGAEIRFEYQLNSEEEDDLAFLQLAVGF